MPFVAQADPIAWHPITSLSNPPQAVRFENVAYVSLSAVSELLGGSLVPPNLSETPLPSSLHLLAQNKSWAFPNGGDRVLDLATRKETMLDHPLLVLNGQHYISAEEGARIFGYGVQLQPQLKLTGPGKVMEPAVADAGSPYFSHEVSDLAVSLAGLIVTADLPVRSSLHRLVPAEHLPVGTRLLQRRTFVLDGQPAALITDASAPARSFIVARPDLAAATKPQPADDTVLAHQQTWFRNAAAKGAALQHGPRGDLNHAVCLTVDFCWSMRRYENPLFESLLGEKAVSSEPVEPVFFLSGRWVGQHPEEMHNLIVLGEQPGFSVTWGLHSWIHPKEGGFLNDLDPGGLRKDTLRLEQLLMRWGIAPTVFYRFPGLIHDELHLRTILEMGLFPVDCESWMAMRLNNESGPFAQPVQDGSIVLVHGNGNEPKGVTAIRAWIEAHQNWRLRGVADFLPSESN